jgi:hypothetical protein
MSTKHLGCHECKEHVGSYLSVIKEKWTLLALVFDTMSFNVQLIWALMLFWNGLTVKV